MSIDIFCTSSNLFLPEVFRSQFQIMGDLGQKNTVAQDVPSWTDIVPMSLSASQAYADGFYLPHQLYFGWCFATYDLLAMNNPNLGFFS